MSHRPRKRFGQNFLNDRNVVEHILASIAPQPADHLVEIGPGEGAITAGLLKAAGRLDAVELDRDLLAALQQRFGGVPQFALHNADALKFDLCALAAASEQIRLTGNLPYNISTPLLFRFLDQADCIHDMHFMLQKEVVDRMVAPPGNRTYGRLSVMLQVRCDIESLFDIGPSAFRPAPKVDSAFVRLSPYDIPPWPISDPTYFAELVSKAFSQRRKTLRNTLKGLITVEQLAAAGIDPGDRAETLAPEVFVALANQTCKLGVSPEIRPLS